MLDREAWHRITRAVLLTIIAVSVVVALRTFPFGYAHVEGDPWNYLAAGERLNAGHPLYALSPGDRPVVLAPPYWSVPLLAPPPIAVLWRPLALLGEPSMWLWGFAGLAGVVGSAWFIGRRGALLVVAILALPLALTAISGNASALILPALLGVWHWRDRPWVVGSLVAGAGAVKLTPFVLILWMIATGRWRALAATAMVLGTIVVISIAGAGLDSYADWIRSAASAAPSPSSISTLTGLGPAVVAALLAIPVLLAWRRDRWSFGAAIVATAIATPALYFPALALLAAVPLWREPDSEGKGHPSAGRHSYDGKPRRSYPEGATNPSGPNQ